MTRLHVPRRLLAILAALSLLAGLSAPAGVLAAPPAGWSINVVELPPFVTPGKAAGYKVTIGNIGPSTLPQTFLTTDTANNPDTVFVSGPGCDAAGTELSCSLPQIKKNKSVSVIVAYDTPLTPGTFSITFELNTTGATDSDGGSSHGDAIRATGNTSLSDDATNFNGRFLLIPGVVQNSQSLNSANPQTVSVNVPLANVPATVQDGPGVVPGPCPAGETCTGWAELHINSGLPTMFTAFMQFDSSLGLPNAANIEFGHISDLNVSEEIDRCTFRRNDPTPTNIPCFTATNIGGGDVAATFYLDENGKTFGH